MALLTGADFFAAFAGAAFAAAFLTATFFRAGAAFLVLADSAFTALAARAFLRFAASFALAAAESVRLGFAGSGVVVSDCPLTAAHRFRCASAIARLPAALVLRRFRGAVSALAAVPAWPLSMARSSAIWASNFSFWASIPIIAAFTISGVSFGVGRVWISSWTFAFKRLGRPSVGGEALTL